MRRWLTGLLLFLLPGLALAQTIEHTTVVRDYVNGLYVRGVPIGGGGASGADQVFLSTGPGAGVWRTVPSNCPLELEPNTHAFVCATGAVGATLGTVGTLQAANGTGGFAAFGGAACTIAGTFTTGMTPTGAQICGAPTIPPLASRVVLGQAHTEFPNGVNLGVLMPGVLTITTTAGVATVSTVGLPSGHLVGDTDPQTLENKTIVDRVNPAPDPATTGGVFTPNPALYDVESFSAIAAPFTVQNFSGSVRPHKWYRLRMRSASPQAVIWDTAYNANARTPLPASTSGSNYDDLFLFEYDPTTGQLEIIFNSQVVAAASGGGGGTATAAGAYRDIQFHDATTGLGADTGRLTHDPAAHVTAMEAALIGNGAGVVTLRSAAGYKTRILADPQQTQDHANTMPDADGPLCTVATCGGSAAVTGTIGDVVSIGGSNLPTDSGVLAANLVTATANHVSGNLVQGAGANKTTSDSGIATNTVVTLAGTQTLLNKLVPPIVTTLTSSTTYTPTITALDFEMQMTASTGTLTMAAPSGGTPANGQRFWLRVLCTNVQTFAWNSIYIASPNIALPTTCPANTTQWMAMGFVYSTVLSKAQLYAVN